MNYFESGYNGQPWIKKTSSEDFFYFDLKTCDASNSFENEIDLAINQMRKNYPNWKFFDDNSVVSQALIPRLMPHEVLSPASSSYDPDFWIFLNSEYQIFHKKDLVLLTLSKKFACPIVWPVTSGRIMNANYSRSLKKSLDIPYWVFLESERFHKIRLCSQDLKLTTFPDFIKLSPQLMRSYFLHPLHLALFNKEDFSEPHNDFIERQIWKTLLPNSQIDLYPQEWTPQESVKILESQEKVAQFPIHLFLEKYFHFKNELNTKEQAWYGSTF